MKIVKLFLFALCINLCQSLIAQHNIPVGIWRMHLSYHHLIDIALAEKQIYSATDNAIFVYDKIDESSQTIAKLDGLSGGGISAIAYSEDRHTLVIGYQDGNIDLIKENVISTISTIKTDNFTMDKKINNIYLLDDVAYLAANFGIGIVDLEKVQIRETIINLGPEKIYEVVVHNDSLFAASTSGVLAASLDPSINILDFNNWKFFDNTSSEVISITVANNRLYAAEKQENIYQYNRGNLTLEIALQGESLVKIRPSQEGLFIIAEKGIWNYTNSTLTTIDNDIISIPNEVLQDDEGIIWIADQTNGLIKHLDTNTAQRIVPSGPFSDHAFHIAFIQNKIFALSGRGLQSQPPFSSEGFYKFEDGRWSNFNQYGVGVIIPQVRDLNDIAYNSATRQFAIASFQDGILLIDEDNSSSVVDMSTFDSSLFSNSISGVAYANDGVWVLNYGQDKSVHHWKNDGTWQPFTLNNSATKYPLDILVVENNDKWLRLDPLFGGGIYVFNEESGKQRLLNSVLNNGGLPSSDVYAIAEDLNGLVWVATSRGVAYFSSSSSIGDNNAIDAIIPRIDFVPLLRDEKVIAIAIDPGNRKWFGTENGAWLFDERGEKKLAHFNINNSLLLSNKILSIGINSINGEVFFATDQGVVSFRGTATVAHKGHKSVKIFPNPVTKDFNGLVAISGLTKDAIVKITDISGKLIRQMRSSGGTAVWNVKDYHGNRAATGVYLVFSTIEDGEDSFVGKLAVVN